jgi:hypothetical protein
VAFLFPELPFRHDFKQTRRFAARCADDAAVSGVDEANSPGAGPRNNRRGCFYPFNLVDLSSLLFVVDSGPGTTVGFPTMR